MTIDPAILKEIFEAGQRRIDAMLAEQGGAYKEGDIVTIPFRCYLCGEGRTDFEMITGDGLVICARCFNGQAAVIAKEIGQ